MDPDHTSPIGAVCFGSTLFASILNLSVMLGNYLPNSVDPDQTTPIGAVCFGSTLFASILNSSAMLGNYLQQTTSADSIFRCIYFLGVLRVNIKHSKAYLKYTVHI